MSQTNFSEILIYGSATPNSVPQATSLKTSTEGVELALNYHDGKLYYKDDLGAVQLLAQKGGGGTVAGVTATAPLVATPAGSVINISFPTVGSMAIQSSSSISVTGGAMDGVEIGGTNPDSGAFTTLDADVGTITTLGATTGNIATVNSTTVNATTFNGSRIEVAAIDDATGTLNIQSQGVTEIQVTNAGAFVTKAPTADLQIANKKYVDDAIIGGVLFKGTWNASTNTPTLTSGVGTEGDLWVISVAGNTNLNGITSWVVGDWALFNGTVWEKLSSPVYVESVNGQIGNVEINATNLQSYGAGTMIEQDASAVSITGGTVSGLTSLAAASGTISMLNTPDLIATGGTLDSVVIGGTNPSTIDGTVITGSSFVGLYGGAF